MLLTEIGNGFKLDSVKICEIDKDDNGNVYYKEPIEIDADSVVIEGSNIHHKKNHLTTTNEIELEIYLKDLIEKLQSNYFDILYVDYADKLYSDDADKYKYKYIIQVDTRTVKSDLSKVGKVSVVERLFRANFPYEHFCIVDDVKIFAISKFKEKLI